MFFKSARRDSAITNDPTEFVEAVRKARVIKIKRPFTLPELRSVLDLANDEWRSMILFGLYTGQRLGDIATPRWNNLISWRVAFFNSEDRQGNSLATGSFSPETDRVFVDLFERTLGSGPSKSI
jgi:integrase